MPKLQLTGEYADLPRMWGAVSPKIFHPSGGIVDPTDLTQTHRIKNAAVLGVRSTFVY